MKVVQNGFGNNFGLVGKSVKRYLVTTALTTTALLAIASPASADNWGDHVATEGSISIDTSVPNTTNIQQHTDFVKVQGDGDINAGWTVNVAQPSSSSKYVLYDIEGDPTFIMGALNANGQIYIFDQNGVIFGADSQVNVGSIIASTGTISDANIKENKFIFENVGANGNAGNIALNGSITVADSGLAAFVAPGVANSGVINAKLGKVVLASGEKVTLDLYGDDLVSIAVDGNLENALIENSGNIKAEGGHVVLAAGAAKQAVDNVINMDGVIDVSSVSVKGGKIVLSGGNKGVVKVAGKLNASGKDGAGDISVTGQNVHVSDTALFLADAFGNGNGGNVNVIAQDHADFRGSVFARGGSEGGNGGFAEISGYGVLGFSGYTDMSAINGTMGTVLLDPTFAVIHSGILHEPLGLGFVLSAQAIANSMKNSNYIVQADQYIDVGTKTGGYNTGNAIVDAFLNALPDGNIDLSSFSIPFVNIVPYPPFIIAGVDTGTTNGSIKFDTDVLNFNRTLKMGNGNIQVDANTVNLGAHLNDKNGNLLGDSRISSNAGRVNVLSNAATIQQGVWLANDAGGATVEVGNGIYTENVSINKGLKLVSKNGRDVTTIDGLSNNTAEATVQIEDGANNVQIGDIGKGFTIKGIDNGNAGIENAAVYLRGNHSNIDIVGNEIVARGDLGLLSLYSGTMSDINIDNNIFSGKTFVGSTPGVGNQFAVNNVPRPVVFFGGPSNGSNKSDIKFTNNTITATAGGFDGATASGNLLVNIDANGATVTGNTFNGTTTGFQGSFRARGTNTLISGNTFYAAGLPDNGFHVYVTPTAYANGLGQTSIMDIWNDNTFVGRATVTDSDVHAGFDFIGLTIQGAVDASTATGANIYVNGGATYNESVLVNKSAYLHGANAGKVWHDVTRGAESIVDPNSPGFHVTADGVTIDGFNIINTSGADGYGVWVDGVDSTTILNNIINNTSSHGVYGDDAVNISISGNGISNVVGSGIFIENGGNLFAFNNDISDVSDAGINIINSGGAFNIVDFNKINDAKDGIRLVNTKALVDFNRIGLVSALSGYGIVAQNSGESEILSNQVKNAALDGIKVSGGNLVKVSDNTVTDIGRVGIYAENATNLLINSNTVDNTTGAIGSPYGGITTDWGSNITISKNTVSNSGHGIWMNDANGTNKIDENSISAVTNIGINLTSSDNVSVDKNTINGTGKEGIYAASGANLSILDNDVDNTGNDGISVNNYTGTVDVSDNTIGMAAAGNIKGDGIYVSRTNNVTVDNNRINGLSGGGHDNNSGVYLSVVKNSSVTGNTITNASWDGVKIAAGDTILADDNNIDGVKREGIFIDNGKNITASNNTIKNVLNTNFAGITAQRVQGVHIVDNDISKADFGVRLRQNVNGAGNNVTGNTIYSILSNGVIVTDSKNVLVDQNDINGTGKEGIYAATGTNLSVVDNDINNTGNDGVSINKYAGAVDVTGNRIGLAAGGNIKGDGVYINETNDVDVVDNAISGLRGGGNDNNSGVYLFKVVGGLVQNNTISNVDWDGVKVAGGSDNLVNDNDISNVAREGVFGNGTSNLTVSNNTITNMVNPDFAGVQIQNSNGIHVEGNTISDADFGVRLKDITGTGNNVTDNNISGIDTNGVKATNAANLLIDQNVINGTGKQGIFAELGKVLTIVDNDIDNTGNDGVSVNNYTGAVDVSDNRIGLAAGGNIKGDGIYIYKTNGATVTDNTINGLRRGGHDNNSGVYAKSSNGTLIENNDITNVDWDGVKVSSSSNNIVNNNRISFTVREGVFGDVANKIIVTGNTIHDMVKPNFAGVQLQRSTDVRVGGTLPGEENTIYNADYGVRVERLFGANNKIQGNTIYDIDTAGIKVSNTANILIDSNDIENAGQFGILMAGPTNGNVVLINNTLTDNKTHMKFESGIIDLTGAGNRFVGGEVGLHFSPFGGDRSLVSLVDDDAAGFQTFPAVTTPTNYGGTIGAQNFDGQSEAFVKLDNNAFRTAGGDAIWLNGLNSTYVTPFGNITPILSAGVLDQPTFDFLEGKFQHYPDNAGLTGIFFFGFVPVDINQSDIFNTFDAFNGDLTGLNVRITGLPNLPGQTGGAAAALNNIQTFAGNTASPENLNNIETAAGGDGATNPQAGNTPEQLNQIESASGGQDTRCWGDAMSIASGGQAVNVVYQGSFTDNLDQAAACGAGI